MARPLRIEFAGALYHVTARGNERKPIFWSHSDRRKFLDVVGEVVERFHLLLHAYVLMDNHYHLLVETLEANLGGAMHALNATYAQAFNRSHRRVGHLFQGRYKALLVEHQAYLLELSRYIHLNPVRAGLLARACDYEWSSAPAYLGNAPPPEFLTIAAVLGHFGDQLRQARRHYAMFLDEKSALHKGSPLDNVVAQTLLGTPEWVEAMRARIDACSRDGRFSADLCSELPALRSLRSRPTLPQVVSAVAAATDTTAQRIDQRHSRARGRAVAIYLANKLAGLSQKEVGAAFGIRSFAVSRAVIEVSRAAACDRKLRRLLRRLTDALADAPR